MVEVFKTNVKDHHQAAFLADKIYRSFGSSYEVNFDLEDCDKILRVKCTTGTIHAAFLINFLKYFGCKAEVLPDNFPPITRSQ